ncbi:hypothetical protein ACFX14_032324 [Malus domestica]
MAFSTTPKTQMPLPPPPTPPPLPPPPPPADHLTGVEVAVRLCRDAQGYHLPRKTGSGNVSVKNSIISTHLQRFCNALKENGKSKGFEESSITTINALNDTIVNGKKLYVSNFIKKTDKIHSHDKPLCATVCVKNLDPNASEDLLLLLKTNSEARLTSLEPPKWAVLRPIQCSVSPRPPPHPMFTIRQPVNRSISQNDLRHLSSCVGEIVKNRGLMVCITIGSAQSQMLELSEKWQTEATPYDYDNPGAGGGGGGDLLDAVVGNALALALVPVPVPAPAPPHQVVDGGAIIPVVGDGDGGGGPGAEGGVLPRDPVLSVYGSMLGWQNPFNFNSRFQFSLNLDIVHGVHEVEHFIRGAYTSLFLNAGFLVPDRFICTYWLDFGEGGGQVMASEQAMALTWQQFYESADCVLALPHMDGKSVNLSRVLEGGIWANRGTVNIRAYGNVLDMEADMVALVYPGFAEFPAHTFQYWVDGICMTTQQILGLQWNVIDRYLTAVDCWDFSARQAAVMGAVAAEMPQDEIGNDMMGIPPELVNE